MWRLILALAVVVVLPGCRGGTASCSAADKAHIQALAGPDVDVLVATFHDAPTMTDAQLSPQRAQIEAIYRDVKSNPWPACAKDTWQHLVQALAAADAAITKQVDNHDQTGASTAWSIANDELNKVTTGLQKINGQ